MILEKHKTELPSTTHQLYMPDSCDEVNYFDKDQTTYINNDSDEDIIVDDEVSKPIKKSRCDEQIIRAIIEIIFFIAFVIKKLPYFLSAVSGFCCVFNSKYHLPLYL